MQWSHTLLGSFDIKDQWIGIDLSRLYLDPIKAEMTLYHELSHAVMSKTTDMGQATGAVFAAVNDFRHLTDAQKDDIKQSLFISQQYVQEGFASFIEMAALRNRTSHMDMLVAMSDMHPDYLARFETLDFAIRFSKKQRERFTKKLSHLALQVNLRRDAVTLKLFQDPDALTHYLSDADNNPSDRLMRLVDAVKKNPKILKYKPRKLARTAGIKYHDPASNLEVCNYLNYILRLSGEDELYTPDMITRVQHNDVLQESAENVLVTNMNLNLSDTAEPLFKYEDIIFEATKIDAVFVILMPFIKETEQLERIFDRKFEIAMTLFRKTGEKYIACVSKQQAEKLLVNELRDATLITKWGITDISNNKFIDTNLRNPNTILYNMPSDLLEGLMQQEDNIKTVESLYIGYTQDHPFQSLILRVNDGDSIHIVNAYGSAGINKVIEYLDEVGKNKKITPRDLLKYAKQINDTLSVMGLRWDIDWVKTMIDQKNLIRR